MGRSRLLRTVIPGVLAALVAFLFAFGAPRLRDHFAGSPSDASSGEAVDVTKEQGEVFRWWIGQATATAPTPTPSPTPTPWPSPYDVGAEELASATAPEGISYAPDERWIAVNLTTQRAYGLIGGQVQHVALVTTGMPDFETKPGEYHINYRVENETMDSETIGIPRDDPLGYYLKDVKWTQYFYPEVALHANYWQPISVFGHVASSHGCVGMLEDDAKWFWDFANYGTRVVVYN